MVMSMNIVMFMIIMIINIVTIMFVNHYDSR